MWYSRRRVIDTNEVVEESGVSDEVVCIVGLLAGHGGNVLYACINRRSELLDISQILCSFKAIDLVELDGVPLHHEADTTVKVFDAEINVYAMRI